MDKKLFVLGLSVFVLRDSEFNDVFFKNTMLHGLSAVGLPTAVEEQSIFPLH